MVRDQVHRYILPAKDGDEIGIAQEIADVLGLEFALPVPVGQLREAQLLFGSSRPGEVPGS